MHAVHAMALGWKLTQPDLGKALAPMVAAPPIAARGDLANLSAMLLQLAASGIEQNHALAKSALIKLNGEAAASDALVSNLAAWISSTERVYYDWHRGKNRTPLVDEITTRTAPLRQQWDARGPGMLREVGQLTEPWFVAEQATVVVVLPIVGGHGFAHLPVNHVTFEAVLTNPHAALPESVRLAWLLGQLPFDLSAVSEHVPAGRVAQLAQMAMLAPTLTAAEEVELAQCSEADIANAAIVWGLASTQVDAQQIARTIWQWWTTYQAGRVSWTIALTALDQLLSAAGRS